MDDQTALDQVIEYDVASRDSERWADFVERSQRGGDYYAGIQTFDAETLRKLRSEGKPAIIINEIMGINNNLSSTERVNRKDARVEKSRGGYDAVAALLTELNRHTMYLCNGDFVKSDVFLDGVRNVVGWFKVEVCYDKEPVTGQVVLRNRPALSVRPDPCCMGDDVNDPKSGCMYITDREWVPKPYLISQYPEYEDEIEQAITEYTGATSRGLIKRAWDYLTNTTPILNEIDEAIFDQTLMNKWRCRVSETWFREYVPRTMVCDKQNWEVWWFNPRRKLDQMRLEMVRQVASKMPKRFEIKEKTIMPLLHVVRRVGTLLLEHVEDPFNGMMLYPLIPFSPFGDTQYDMGMNDNLIGPQDELNKRITNATHLLNQTANGGMIVKNLSAGYGDVLRDYGSSNNFIVELDKCGGMFEKIQPNPISPGHITLAGLSENFLEKVSGVTGSVRGFDDVKNESGRLFSARVQRAMTTNQLIFDRFDRACQTTHFVMMEITRRTNTYTDAEIAQIVDEKELIDEGMLNEARQQVMQEMPPPEMPDQGMMMGLHPINQVMVQNKAAMAMEQYRQVADVKAFEIAKETLLKQYKDSKTGQYNVIVIQSPAAQTTQLATFAELTEMVKIIPPQVIAPAMIEYSSLPKPMKDEMVQKLELMMQAPPPTPGPQKKGVA